MGSEETRLFRTIGMLLMLCILLALSATDVAAEAYPSKPVRMIVPYPPGGTTDVIGRLIAGHLSERLGQRVLVDNKGGGGSIIGTEAAARSAPDGYTLFIPSGAYAIQPALQKLPYDPLKAFTPISRVISGPIVLIVNEHVPVNSVNELIALAKQKPGQLIFVTSGMGGNPHLGIELFKIMAGIDFKIVHFRGGGPAMTDLLGGHSHAAINSIPQALPHIKSGRFKVLGTSGEERSTLLPDVPTIAEAGLPGYEVVQWFGVSAPAGTPAPIIDRLSKEIQEFLAQGKVKKRFLDAGAEVGYQGPADFGRFIERDIARWKIVVEKANIKLE